MIVNGDNALCLQEATHMASEQHQLCNLFVTLFHDCSPSDPLAVWMEFRLNICDDLQHALQSKNIVLDPTQDQVFDYGLYLINYILSAGNKSLRDWPAMPLPQGDWAVAVRNRLIAEQHAYNREEQTTLADEQIPTLTEGQQAAFKWDC